MHIKQMILLLLHVMPVNEKTFSFFFSFSKFSCCLGYGGLSLSIEGPSKADIECHDNEDGSCLVTYKPTEPGLYIVNVKFADKHVPGLYLFLLECCLRITVYTHNVDFD